MATKRRLTEQGEIRFYEWLENMIEKEGSAKRFSENTGLGESEVSKLRKSVKAPTRYTVEMLAKAYGLAAEDIVGEDGIRADIIPRGDVTGLPKKKKPEQKEEPQPAEEAIPLSYIKDQIEQLSAEIEIRRDAIRHYQMLMKGWSRRC